MKRRLKRLLCFVGHHEKVKAIDRADLNYADAHGMSFTVKSWHWQCARCGMKFAKVSY